MAYDKDMQEDKEGVFDAIDNLKFALTIYAAMVDGMKVNKERMRNVLETDFSNATDMADYLAKKVFLSGKLMLLSVKPFITASKRASSCNNFPCRSSRI